MASPPRPAAIDASAKQAPPAAPLLLPQPAPEPVYRNPKIGVVHLRAHEDAQGRLLGPQVMYQVVDPGGWNLEAVERGGGIIAPANREAAPNAVSPYAPQARETIPPPADSPLLDPDQAGRIGITGLMSLGDKTAAEAMAAREGGDRIAIFDDQAGWLLIPRAAAK
jgi:hypothetical protein